MTLSVIGQPVVQIEGVAKVSGSAEFAADVLIDGALTCKILRSPYPHARIVRIDASKARALPGVHAVITGADLPDALFGRRVQDMPVLAKDKVRFVGERVAAVAAENKEIAEEALNLIEVEYEELPGVFDPAEAMKPGAPEVHPSVEAYRNHLDPVPATKNTFAHQVLTKGDVDRGFAQADRVFEHTFRTQSHHQGYLEPHAAIVQITDDGKVHVWECNKQPLAGRTQLAHLTGLPPERIVVNAVHMGADFGGKGSIMDTAVAYWLAKASGRPVRTVMSYTEELTAANPRNPGVITMKTGVKNDGAIVAHHSVCVWNTGAYSAFLPAGIVGGGLWAAGLYRVPNVKFENIGVYTNCTPRGHVRAPGAPQVAFALESHVDMMAQALGIDPIEFRMRNLIETGEESALGEPFEDLHAKETLQAVVDAAHVAQASSPAKGLVGRGVTMYDRHTGSGMCTVDLVVRDGHAILYTAAPDTGTGNHTIMQQIIAEELKLPLSQIAIRMSDSEVITEDTGVGGSRVTHVYGLACQQAAREAREKLLAAAARRGGTFPEALEGTGEEVRVHVTFEGHRPDGCASVCAQMVEVEVDPDTGRVNVRKIWSAHDVGTVINPMYHQGQIDGGAIYGLGFAVTEELLIEDGKVLNPNLGEYKLPNIADIPELETILVTGASGPTPYGGKAVGEMANVPLAAGVANAVYNACGVRITELPITAEKVYRGLLANV